MKYPDYDLSRSIRKRKADRQLDEAAKRALSGPSVEPTPEFLRALLAETPMSQRTAQTGPWITGAATAVGMACVACVLVMRSGKGTLSTDHRGRVAAVAPTKDAIAHSNGNHAGRDPRKGPIVRSKAEGASLSAANSPRLPSIRATPDGEFLDPGRSGVAVNLGGAPKDTQKLDDGSFISPSPTLYADVVPPSPEELKAEAANIQEQTREVDARLFHNVSLALKHASFEEVCGALAKQTGVEIVAARNVRFDNATIYVNSRPAREVMREISRVFGFTWEREGRQDSYTYTLRQTPESEVAEEKQRNDNVSRATQKLFERVRLLSTASDSRGRLNEFGWPDGRTQQNATTRAADRAFSEMSQDELSRLQAGESVTLTSDPNRAESLDPVESNAIIRSMGGVHPFMDSYMAGGSESDPTYEAYAKMKEPQASITFSMVLTEFGGIKLHMLAGASGIWSKGARVGSGVGGELADVPGATESDLDNAKANADLAGIKELSHAVSVSPTPTTPVETQGAEPAYPTDHLSMDMLNGGFKTRKSLQPPHPFMTSDDFWQAFHGATGRDIVTDSFSRLFRLENVNGSLFEVLNRECDAMHYRWRLDEKFITGRSASFVWQRLSEVPKKTLMKWQVDRKKTGALPLNDLLEMARLTDRQLDSIEVGKAIFHQWNVKEWSILSRPMQMNAYEVVRPIARFLSDLPDNELELAVQGRLPVKSLSRAVQGKIAIPGTGYDGGLPQDAVIGAAYLPCGIYFWSPFFEHGKEPVHGDLFTGRTREEVVKQVKEAYGECHLNEIQMSDGKLGLMIVNNGEINQIGDGHFGEGWRFAPPDGK